MLAYHAIEQQATFHAFDIDQLRARLAASSAPNAWRCGLAWILAETGNKQAARRELDLLADAGFASAPRDPNRLASSLNAARPAPCWARRTMQASSTTSSPHSPSATSPPGRAVVSEGSAHRVLGLLAAVTGQLDLAVDHLEAAAAANARMGLQPFVVRAQAQLVAMLHARGDHKRPPHSPPMPTPRESACPSAQSRSRNSPRARS